MVVLLRMAKLGGARPHAWSVAQRTFACSAGVASRGALLWPQTQDRLVGPTAWLSSGWPTPLFFGGAPMSDTDGLPRGNSEYDLSLGKIVDTLRADYLDFFVRESRLDIYDEAVIFELGSPFESTPFALRGRRAYGGALSALRVLGGRTVRDATVQCRIYDGTPYGCALRVPWTCRGKMQILGLEHAVHISAVSLYAVKAGGGLPPAAAVASAAPGATPLAYLIHRHKLEVVEIHPPSLRSLLAEHWWRRRPEEVQAGPALAHLGVA